MAKSRVPRDTRNFHFDAASDKFIEEKRVTPSVTSLVEVFGSGAEYPCLPAYIDRYGTKHLDKPQKSYSLLKPEPDCQRMHEYFEKVKVPSYLTELEGFELPPESVMRNTKFYDVMAQFKDEAQEKDPD